MANRELNCRATKRISRLLAKELCKRKPNSRVVRDYTESIHALIKAQCDSGYDVRYVPCENIEEEAKRA